MESLLELNTLVSSIKEGILICDGEAKIIYFNKSYSDFIGKKLDEVKHVPLKDLRPGARLPEVIKSGNPIIGMLRKESKEEYFCNMYPIYKNNVIVGGLSIVTFLKDAVYLSKKIREIENRNSYLIRKMRESNGTRYTFDSIIAEDIKSLETKASASKIAKFQIPIFLKGESGSGKEVYAQSIHNESPRREFSFVPVNCAALSPTMIESELFGYEEGAFTGAKKGGRIGLFEKAHKGTIFLDEISEIDYSLQAKLLRVLQENTIRRIGGVHEISVEVRVISACNVDIMSYIEEGKFRKDLYYRLAAFTLEIIPLRERRNDIEPLLDYYLNKISIKLKRDFSFHPDAKKALIRYNWPGNIREMKNVLEISTIMATEDVITLHTLPIPIIDSLEEYPFDDKPLSEKTKEFEKTEVKKAISLFGESVQGKKQAADYLGISLASLYNKLNN